MKLSNGRGETLAGVIVTDRIRPDVVAIHHGSWHDTIDRGAEKSLDVNGNVASTALVKIEK